MCLPRWPGIKPNVMFLSAYGISILDIDSSVSIIIPSSADIVPLLIVLPCVVCYPERLSWRCALQTSHIQAWESSRFSFSVCSEEEYTSPVLADFWICPGWLHTFENNQHLVKSILWVQFWTWDTVYDHSSIWVGRAHVLVYKWTCIGRCDHSEFNSYVGH